MIRKFFPICYLCIKCAQTRIAKETKTKQQQKETSQNIDAEIQLNGIRDFHIR